jgi:hypothetical protein
VAAALIIVGALLLTAGAAWIFPPAGLIVGGLVALGLGLDMARDIPTKGTAP